MSDDICTGEMITESPMTGNIYQVTRWVDLGDGNIQALEKELMNFAVLDDEGYVKLWGATRHEAIGKAALLDNDVAIAPFEWLERIE